METEGNVNLKLDTDSVRERTGVRSSLTDINQVFVFTDTFKERKEAVEREQKTAEENLRGTVFAKAFEGGESADITDLMFMESTEELLIRNEQEAADKNSWTPAWLVVAAILIGACAAAFVCKKNRKGKKKQDDDDQLKAVA